MSEPPHPAALQGQWPERGQAEPDGALTLDALEPDAFAAVCEHLEQADVAALTASCSALSHAVRSNDRLWSSLFHRQFPEPWQKMAGRQALRGPQRQRGGGGVAPGGWRDVYLATHTQCQQLRSTAPVCREWTTDATAVHLAALHGSGPRRLTIAVQGSGVEVRCAPELGVDKSYQLYGHTARVSAVGVVPPAGALRRIGLATASHDQTVRLWAGNADPESWEFRSQPLSLLTPLRTLRGHHEAITSLQLLSSGTGVTIAATGSKDRTVRLWGLAPLAPSPVQKQGIATLRGHGAPITCLALAGGRGDAADGGGGSAGSGAQLLSGSLDARVKAWDPWTATCVGTAKCAAPVAAMQPVAALPLLQPHGLFVCGGATVQLLDLRSFKPVAGVVLPAEHGEQVHCFSQCGWDLAVGASHGARVYDLRMLGGTGQAAGGGGSGGRGLPERLRLAGHARPVTSISCDPYKTVTATDRYGPAPVRVWCTESGDCLAELDSCLPPPLPPAGADSSGGGAGAAANGADGGDAAGAVLPDVSAEAAAAVAAAVEAEEEEAEPSGGRARQQYHRGWEGVTAMACRGALLVTGSSEGNVLERDFSHGGLPEGEGEGAGGGGLAGKFWQWSLASDG